MDKKTITENIRINKYRAAQESAPDGKQTSTQMPEGSRSTEK